jgi:hypothetical protein
VALTGTRASMVANVAGDGGGRHQPDERLGPVPSSELACHIRACEAPAATRCASCKRWFCPRHICTVHVERRGDRVETLGHRGLLERMPSRTEAFRVCVRCWKRPIDLDP